MSEITYQMVLSTLQTVSLMVGVFYYLFNMRNAQKTRELALKTQEQAVKTRQLQLYTGILHAGGKEFYRSYMEVIYNQEWEDFDDFMRKYGPVSNPEAYLHTMTVGNYFQEIGVLAEQEAMDPEIMWKHMGRGNVIRVWEKMGPLIKEFRRRYNDPMFWLEFENFYNEMKKITDERLQELKT